MIEQLSIWEDVKEHYKITKPIRLIELFAGIGSQHEALKRLGFEINRSTICEWSIQSTQAYNDIHIQDYNDYSKGKSKDELVEILSEFGVSSDYNMPMTKEQLKRKQETQLRTIYNNIIATNNLVNIMTTSGDELDIVDTNKYEYVMTYSFPCQDLSLAGKGLGMARDGETRSGLLWQVERLLKETKELPQILLMENVPEVIGTNNIKHFQEWELFLQNLGYSNFCEVLNAKDYGIPQNRNRCFMVSILGDWLYRFPQKQELKLRLKDMLENEVDEKYYLTAETLEMVNEQYGVIGGGKWDKMHDIGKRVYNTDFYSPTIHTMGGGNLEPKVIFKSKDKRLPEMLDKIDFDSEEPQSLDLYNRAVSNISQAITLPNHNSQAIAIKTWNGDTKALKTKDKDMPRDRLYFDDSNLSFTITTIENQMPSIINVVGGELRQDEGLRTFNDNLMGTLRTIDACGDKVVAWKDQLSNNNLRIRKLTPKECWRLMGQTDETFDLAQVHQSNSTLYHQAGDSIVVNVLEAIFRQMKGGNQ